MRKRETGVEIMQAIKQLNLLQEVKKRHPSGIIEARNNTFVTLIELGSSDFRTPEMLNLLKEYWRPTKDDTLYIINLEGIDVLTPSAAKILVESAPDIASEFKIPIIFINVRQAVMESLESEAVRCEPPRIIWVVDQKGEAHLVGKVPNKLYELLMLLEEQGEMSASSIAALQSQTTSKKAVGNLSVYLQKLFNAGLVSREKVTALEREDAERGWTYNYYTAPTIQRNSKPETYIEKP